jgi:hypothetical protein
LTFLHTTSFTSWVKDVFSGVHVSDASNFSKLVPGFEFLQGLVKGAGAALPNMGQWVAPTLNPEELEKRINELRTVQFWLEQNARMLGATVQALEVQRMTLATLKNMNVQMEDLRDSLKVKAPEPAPEATSAQNNHQAAASPTSAVDPMQWWGALTKQFTDLAAAAVKDSASTQAPQPEGVAPAQAATKAAQGTLPPANRPATAKTSAAKTRGARLGSKR